MGWFDGIRLLFVLVNGLMDSWLIGLDINGVVGNEG
mgnify:CR=1 FL=1